MVSRPNKGARPGKRPGQSNQIRIIGGEHGGRKLRFPDHVGLRPTSDRVRETLFNWLMSILPGADCLDLFAASGAIGFEAASRGAGSVTMLDTAPVVVRQLRENCGLLGLENVVIQQANASTWLDGPSEPFEIVFLDPPFADDLLEGCCEKLEANGWLAPEARIYIEMDAHKKLPPPLPANWQQLKEKKAGQVAFFLYLRGN
ncbi:16S rRNA (guanine(966)-N(2))-methyltransferase RsmD [Solemya velesiana gill symbiont]|uniref:Ribosomal RNA small subunit methyltransferase D n=1 Tax=Solemya velesiana gill symbiont TaxID=1918948 RepID=A0A1T2KU90_9GAMM|nr:16S rRNA (guanine(966)-N(2))-methyltransferase RsmD [Solemya velesiana gill symbiont]OOZ36286.1 16S rRNA (guanine(966)-N(2))-methyltransferase RsmD [Solemya velesiana gill symbiont]